MSVWRAPKPVIAQVHGWCVGGGSDFALCADLVDRQRGRADRHALLADVGRLPLRHVDLPARPRQGEGVRADRQAAVRGRSGRGRADQRAVPFARARGEVARAALGLAAIPASQLAAMKLVVNHAYENMGLASTQTLGPILDGLMRNTPDAKRFIELAGGGGRRGRGRRARRPLRRLQPGGRRSDKPDPEQRDRALAGLQLRQRFRRGSSRPTIRSSHCSMSATSRSSVASSICSMSIQSLGRSNIALQTARCSGDRKEGSRRAKGSRLTPLRHLLVDRVVGEEEVDRVLPHQSRHCPSRRRAAESSFVGVDAERNECIDDLLPALGRDEHVEVDVDRRPRLGVVGEGQRPSDRVGDLRTRRRFVDRDDLVGERRLVCVARGVWLFIHGAGVERREFERFAHRCRRVAGHRRGAADRRGSFPAPRGVEAIHSATECSASPADRDFSPSASRSTSRRRRLGSRCSPLPELGDQLAGGAVDGRRRNHRPRPPGGVAQLLGARGLGGLRPSLRDDLVSQLPEGGESPATRALRGAPGLADLESTALGGDDERHSG